MPPEERPFVPAFPPNRTWPTEPVRAPHELHGFWQQNLFVLGREATTTQKHQVKSSLVGQRADQASSVLAHNATSGEHRTALLPDPSAVLGPLPIDAHQGTQRRLMRPRPKPWLLTDGLHVLLRCIQRGHALPRDPRGHAVARVLHADGVEQLHAQESVQRLARQDLYDPARDVQAEGVHVALPRVEAERQGGDGLAQLLQAPDLAAVALLGDPCIGFLIRTRRVHAKAGGIAQAR
mmetsp:Transcript_33051/g.83962  ORF Transcript_33051/g.83962 Transcript_33051/m.83962 type:complete len:236 (-) Transcript_33051:544-1251(-)